MRGDERVETSSITVMYVWREILSVEGLRTR